MISGCMSSPQTLVYIPAVEQLYLTSHAAVVVTITKGESGRFVKRTYFTAQASIQNRGLLVRNYWYVSRL